MCLSLSRALEIWSLLADIADIIKCVKLPWKDFHKGRVSIDAAALLTDYASIHIHVLCNDLYGHGVTKTTSIEELLDELGVHFSLWHGKLNGLCLERRIPQGASLRTALHSRLQRPVTASVDDLQESLSLFRSSVFG